WGYSYTDRSAKHAFQGVLLPSDQMLALQGAGVATTSTYLPIISSTNTNHRFYVYTDWPQGGEWPEPPGPPKYWDKFVPSGFAGDDESVDVYACDRSDPYS